MKILFDFRVYEREKYRGIGRYIFGLVDHIIKNFPNIKIAIVKENKKDLPKFNYLCDNDITYYFIENNKVDINEIFDFYFIDDILMRQWAIKSNEKFFDDVFNKIILEHVKQILTISYDIIPLLFKDYYLKDNNFKTKYLLLIESLSVCSHIFSISNSTKNDLIEYININKENITNIYGGVDNKFINAKKNDYIFSNRKNNIVFVAGADKRKNPQGLIRGFSIAYNSKSIPRDSKLFICSKMNDDFKEYLEEQMKKSNISKDQIIITGFIDDEELISLISDSKATFFPSYYEGLGLPILESYQLNTAAFASNLSSTKELVLKECSFDPYDDNSIANSIIESLTNERLCNNSLEFGKNLLTNYCNWDIASKKVINKLEELNNKININIAIFGVLPPEKTGIANYNAKTFGINNNFHVFSNFINTNNYFEAQSYIKNNFQNNFIPIEYYNKFKSKYLYNKKIFVIGNSFHNLIYYKYAVLENDKKNSYLYLHEVNLMYFIADILEKDLNTILVYIEKSYKQVYKQVRDIKDFNKIVKILNKNHIYGIEILISCTNITNIIINNDKAKELIEKEYHYNNINRKLNIVKMFHPIEKIEALKLKKLDILNDNYIYIGSFGVINKYKNIDIIIDAINILNDEYNKNIRLVLAGFNITHFIKSLDENKSKNIVYFDSPTLDDLLSLMSSVNLAIQFRKHSFGESSGIISQLLGISQKIILTKDFMYYKDAKNIRGVESNISSQELAKIILEELDIPKIKNDSIYYNYSYNKLANELLNI